jgi:3-oxoadipate enol-lactonase
LAVFDERSGMARAQTDDRVGLSYEVRGTGPRNLLFMHGWAGSGEYFKWLIDHLDLSRVRAISYDMRGHGDSEKPDVELSLERLARDGLTVADAAGASTFVTVGFSMSGKFAQYLAVLEPARVEGLVLVAGAPAAEIPLPPELLADWYARQGDAAKFVELLEPYMTARVDPEVLERFGQIAAKTPLTDLERTMNLLTSVSFADRVSALEMPILVIAGANDILLPPSLLKGMADGLKNARLEIINCGHEIPIEKPKELAERIEAFLAGLESSH